MIPNSNPVLEAALAFHGWGYSVVPASINGSKAPLSTWKKYQSERAGIGQLHEWFGSGHSGIGIVAGSISGGLELLELEGRAVKSGLLDEAKEIAINSGLEDIWNVMVNGYSEMTPSGGIHWLYRIAGLPDGVSFPPNTKIARRSGDNGEIDVLAETRGEGGFVITAPSHGKVHPSGKPWVIMRGSPESIPTLSWEERQAVHDCFRVLDKMPIVDSNLDHDLSRSSDPTGKPGDDYNARADWNEILIPLGWKNLFTSKGVTYWRRPKKDIGISATTGRNEADNLFVFTTSSVFEAEKPYSKFSAYTLLEFGSLSQENFRKAASLLRTRGFGAISAVQDHDELRPKPETSLAPSLAVNLSQTINSMDQPSDIPTPAESPSIANIVRSEDEIEEFKSSWLAYDLAPYINGTFKPILPTIFKRCDGIFMLYPSKVHSFYGESASGKSWIALIACSQLLIAGKKVTFIDFESDAQTVVGRLFTLKVTPDQILNGFTYIKPESARAIDDPAWQAILEPNSAVLVVIDGVTEALTMWGGETNNNDEVTRWMRVFPRTIAEKSGATVVTIDHVTKNSETRGRHAIGAQAKMAALDGAGFLIESIEGIAPGRTGRISMRVTKDRDGMVKTNSGEERGKDNTAEIAIFSIDSTRPTMEYVIGVPLMADELQAKKEDQMNTLILRWVNENPACSKRAILKGVKGNQGLKSDAVVDLVSNGYLDDQGIGRSSVFYVSDKARMDFGLPIIEVRRAI